MVDHLDDEVILVGLVQVGDEMPGFSGAGLQLSLPGFIVRDLVGLELSIHVHDGNSLSVQGQGTLDL